MNRRNIICALAAFAAVCATVAGQENTVEPAPAGANTLTAAEKEAGWKLLWDGSTNFVEWVGAWRKDFPKKGWVVREPNVLTVLPARALKGELPPEQKKLGGGGDIVTRASYRSFDFKFDFRLTEGANSGVKYFFDEKQDKGSCEEYQIMDKAHPDQTLGRDGNHRVASLYDLVPAQADEIVRGPGKWNHGEVVVRGDKVEHWLNGVKVVEYVRGGEAFRAAVAKSKYASWGRDRDGNPQPWGEIPEGRILLQDHYDSTVSFCNLKVRDLSADGASGGPVADRAE